MTNICKYCGKKLNRTFYQPEADTCIDCIAKGEPVTKE